MDHITVKRLKVSCIIGCNPSERTEKQDLFITFTLDCCYQNAASSDNLKDTVNYDALARQITSMAQGSSFFLIETMAQRIADICLDNPQVAAATVTVEKPNALANADFASVTITRKKDSK